MTRTLLIAATLAASLGAAAPALADHDGCNGCGPGQGWAGTSGYDGRYDRGWSGRNDRHLADNGSQWHRRLLPSDRVEDELRHQNFRHIDFAGRDGDIYRYNAVDPHGHKVRLAVNAYDGRIVEVKRR